MKLASPVSFCRWVKWVPGRLSNFPYNTQPIMAKSGFRESQAHSHMPHLSGRMPQHHPHCFSTVSSSIPSTKPQECCWSALKAWVLTILLKWSHSNVSLYSTILPDTSRKSRQKTRAVGKTTDPVFNHTMVYDGFRPEDLTEACVELTVWDHYKLTNQLLGGLRIGFGTGNTC